ncbi:uncharacterized protein LOC129808464 [Phlebotomus papatasi]|uniref:uncharacterized protein LOC129808464 n=1 Tax=Phlebotomus papatasi TaxID=29031 RepID=UPI0024838FC5|nr:uncharacterized protein LOC129808464 [Phlebotomus papatasi]
MYRQVLVAPEDRDYLRILWRENCDEDIQTYRLTTVTYGTACAPYLATRVLHQIAQDYEAEFPRASQEICKGFYMDDFLGGADSLEEANQLRNEIQTILAKGGFNLRKWASNSSKILDRIPSDYQAVTPEDVAHGLKRHTVLGVAWSPGEDTLSVVDEPLPSVSTMRELCWVSAKIYDPLGMISPVTAALRILFQKLWSYSIGWDDDLPAEVLEEYNIIKEEIEFVSQVKLPRLINPSNSQIELQGFADASERGYGAVIYARGPEQDQRFVVRFLIAKSRVAPRNVVTIPRLELCAALLLSLLVQKVKQAYSSHNITVTAWTDSQVVLHWLHGHPSRWKMFVANRTNQILEVIPASQWKHVASRDNPADCISRGMTPKALANHPLWPSGPSWLQNNSDDWPVSLPNFNNDVLTGEEKLPVTQSLVVQKTLDPNEIFLMFSDVSRLIRSVAHILRWRHKLSKGDNLNVTELDTARNQLIKVAQKECFSDEIKCLQQGRILPCGSKLSPLVPFLDSEGIVRVKGRIQNSKLDYSARHPIVLSGKHLFTLKLIEKAHQVHLHSGLTLTQSVLREKYWIIGERKSVKSVINKCVICFKAKPKGQTPQMGNLPTVRVRQARPFINTGCDFAGPFTLRASKLRKAVLVKGYLCLFICMATKAVHLEVVSDLTTDAFIAALRRFTARRGHCDNIYCDNAKNFVGAAQPSDSGDVIQAVKKHRDRVVNFMAESGTQFHFIPACSPTFGGLWERGVANVKHHLRRVLSDTKLTYEEMSTVVAEIEACLNSRPLCPLSSSPDDFEALTPGHLLITQPLTMSPGPDYLAENPNRLTRWQFLQRLVQEFWKRWYSEYVTSLQPRQKWRNNEENLKIGDLVLLRSDNFKGLWTLGRISEVHPGADSIVRVVTVKTPTGTYRRAVNRLARLPIES